MVRVEYVLPLGENARKRHFHESRHGAIIAFAVQLEVCLEGAWFPEVRYDNKHGISHIDRYRRSGESRKQLLFLSFEEALALADKDIKERWHNYQVRFMRGEWP